MSKTTTAPKTTAPKTETKAPKTKAPKTETKANPVCLSIIKAFLEADKQTLNNAQLAEISDDRVQRDIGRVRKEFKINIIAIKEDKKITAYKLTSIKPSIKILTKNGIEVTVNTPEAVVKKPRYKAIRPAFKLLEAPEGGIPASPYANNTSEVSIIEMTPQKALEILSFYNNSNRFPTMSRVQKYIDSMGGIFTIDGVKVIDMALYQGDEKADEHYEDRVKRSESTWLFNGDSIRFNKQGILQDGQHRLWGLVLSNTTHNFVQILGLEDEAFTTMDYGKLRNSADVLFISQRGEEVDDKLQSQLSKLVAGALQWARAYKDNVSSKVLKERSYKLSRKTTDNFSITEVIEDYKGLIDSAKFIHTLSNSKDIKKRDIKVANIALNSTDLVFLHYQTALINTELANEFIESLLTGWEISKDAPVTLLREWLSNSLKNNKKTEKQEIYRRVVTTWNKFVHGEEMPTNALKDNKHLKEDATPKVGSFPIFQSEAIITEEEVEAVAEQATTEAEPVAEVVAEVVAEPEAEAVAEQATTEAEATTEVEAEAPTEA